MKNKNLLSILIAASMAVAPLSVFAKTSEEYDGKSYAELGIASDDTDGKINLAVIANNDVNFKNTMTVQGSVYSNGTIYAWSNGHMAVEGLFISGTKNEEQYIIENNEKKYLNGYVLKDTNGTYISNPDVTYNTKPEYEGAVYDDDTSFTYSLSDDMFDVPEIENVIEYKAASQWGNKWNDNLPLVISESTHFNKLDIQGKGVTVDLSKSDVILVIDNLGKSNASDIAVTGTEGNDNQLFLYINGYEDNKFNLGINWNGDYPNYIPNDEALNEYMDKTGDPDRVKVFLTKDAVDMDYCHISGDVYINTTQFSVTGSTLINGHITTNATAFDVQSSAYFRGVVMAPNAATAVSKKGTVIGQVYTDTLEMEGEGRIIYNPDTMRDYDTDIPNPVAPSETEEPTATPAATEAPTEIPVVTEEPTEQPAEPSENEEIFPGSSQYAYIFGDEPLYIEGEKDKEGNVISWTVEVNMQPEREVSRQEVCAMIMRLVDQCKGSVNAGKGDIAASITDYAGWAEKGMGYLSQKGAYDDIDYTVSGYAYPTRGEVAKLVVKGLGLTLQQGAIKFTDISGTEFEQYINIMTSNGYMQGNGDGTFRPEDSMTRAEFCSMFNNVTGRANYELIDTEGSLVTPDTYYIVDLDTAASWQVEAMMLGTSAFTDDKKVDVLTRIENIRNKLDDFEGQLEH